MKKVGFVYDDIFLLHEMPPGHPESAERLRAITGSLEKSDIQDHLIRIKPRMAARDEILQVHTASYFERVSRFTGYYDPDTYISAHSAEAALYAAGAVIEAIGRCRSGEIDRAFCAVRPPGHHAETDRAMGFCIFNNAAIGARFAQKSGYKKVFIADFDVHHGNGTQHTFEQDDSVFYFSTHQYPHYPGTGSERERGKGKGEGFTFNVPMPHGAGDKEYIAVFDETLPPLVKGFSPDVVIVSAGYDLHAADPLGGLKVTNEGIRHIVRSLLFASAGVPSVFCLEGGYNLRALSDSVVITIEELLRAG